MQRATGISLCVIAESKSHEFLFKVRRLSTFFPRRRKGFDFDDESTFLPRRRTLPPANSPATYQQ